MQKAFVGLISLTLLVAVAVMSLVIQNIHALSILETTMISNIENNLSPWSLIVSGALSLFDVTTAKISDVEQSDSPKYTTVSSSSETRTVRTGFTYNHGFKFQNLYDNYYHLIPDKIIPDFIYDGGALEFAAGSGRCGGMAFAALDYWFAGQHIPGWNVTPPPKEICGNGRDDDNDNQIDEGGCSSPGNPAKLETPPNDAPLSQYILDRLLDSLDISLLGILKQLVGVALTFSPASSVGNLEELPRYIYLTFGPIENKFESRWFGCTIGCLPGVRPLTDKEVIEATRSLDQKKPVVLGLIHSTSNNPARNHQVVAYGYSYDKAYNRYTFFIWDNNKPNMEIKADWSPGVKYGKLQYYYQYFDKVKGFTTAQFTDYEKNWAGFFVEDYTPKTPPVMFIDIDKDGIDDSKDNCSKANPDQKDTNNNGVGDLCEAGDIDNDGVLDSVDNCKWVANPDQNTDACKDVIL